MSTQRAEAFSDGVLAIAITLLILDVVVRPGDRGLAHALVTDWPQYAAYVVSFATIGVMWVNHHGVFARIVRVDRPVLFANLAVLAAISFLPFPTRVMAEYVLAGGADATSAAVLYGINCLCIAGGFFVLWETAKRRGVFAAGVDDARIAASQRRAIVGPLGYAAGVAVAFVSPPASLAIYGALALYYCFDASPWETATTPEPAADPAGH